VDGLSAKNDPERELERALRACGLFHSCFPHEGGRSPRRGRVLALTPGCAVVGSANGPRPRLSYSRAVGRGRAFPRRRGLLRGWAPLLESPAAAHSTQSRVRIRTTRAPR
jgi:hypothetical protein